MKSTHTIGALTFLLTSFFVSQISAQENSWQPLNGPDTTEINCICARANGSIFVGSSWGIYRSTNLGESWSNVSPDSQRIKVWSITEFPGSYIFFSAYPGAGLYRSADDGLTWQPPNLDNEINNIPIQSLAGTSANTLFAGTGGGVFRSTNYGATWQNVLMSKSTTCFATTSNGDIFAGGTQQGYGLDGIYRSTTGGASWVAVDSGLRYSDITALVADSENRLYAVTYVGASYRSTNNGDFWTDISDPNNVGTSCTSLAANSHEDLFLGRYSHSIAGVKGVSSSHDHGASWIDFGEGLADQNILSLAVTSDGYLLAGTASAGAFRTKNPTTVVRNLPMSIPNSLTLYQNYPNPFNPSTTIEFQLPASGFTTLTIYDPLGKEVSRLISQFLSSGRHKVSWSPYGISSGVYFYQLTSGRDNKINAMLLLR